MENEPINVRELRTQRLKWSQERLADYLGVDRATVSRIETGQPPSGPVERLLRQLADQTPANLVEAI